MPHFIENGQYTEFVRKIKEELGAETILLIVGLPNADHAECGLLSDTDEGKAKMPSILRNLADKVESDLIEMGVFTGCYWIANTPFGSLQEAIAKAKMLAIEKLCSVDIAAGEWENRKDVWRVYTDGTEENLLVKKTN